MLATMNDEFSRRFEKAQLVEILQELKESLGTLDDVEQYRVSCTIYNTRMSDGNSVTNHILYVIKMIERLGKLRCSLHEQFGKDAILNSLFSSYFTLSIIAEWLSLQSIAMA